MTNIGIQPILLATSTEELKIFVGEKYVSEEGYIILRNDKVESLIQSDGVLIETDTIPVFYKGDFYNFTIYISETEGAKATSTDKCETLNVNGIIYTKITE